MSSMIDVVFLLLVFFVMTFQITALEGNVEIATAAAPAEGGDPPREMLFRVRLRAKEDGSLAGIRFDGRELRDTTELRSLVTSIVDDRPGDEYTVQLTSDDVLRYQHAMDAITAIRGGGEGPVLIQKIQFITSR